MFANGVYFLTIMSFSQSIDMDNGPRASSPHPTPKEVSCPSEHVKEDISDLDDPEPEDDISPTTNVVTVSSIKKLRSFPSPI